MYFYHFFFYFSVLVNNYFNPQVMFCFQLSSSFHFVGSEQTAVWCLATCRVKQQHLKDIRLLDWICIFLNLTEDVLGLNLILTNLGSLHAAL